MGGAWFFGCAGVNKNKTEEVEPTLTPVIGRVASLHLDDGFVLVETFGQWTYTQGIRLSSMGDEGRAATLVVSGERMGRYAAADVKAGEIEVGDAVMLRPMSDDSDNPEQEKAPRVEEDVPAEPSD